MEDRDTESTLRNLILMYKGSSACAQSLADFKVCRATPAGQATPETCEALATGFMTQYHDMVKTAKTNCSKEYASALQCMQENIDSQTETCTSTLDAFANCQ